MNDEMEFEGRIWRLGDGWIFVNEQPTATVFEQRNAVLLQGEICICRRSVCGAADGV